MGEDALEIISCTKIRACSLKNIAPRHFTYYCILLFLLNKLFFSILITIFWATYPTQFHDKLQFLLQDEYSLGKVRDDLIIISPKIAFFDQPIPPPSHFVTFVRKYPIALRHAQHKQTPTPSFPKISKFQDLKRIGVELKKSLSSVICSSSEDSISREHVLKNIPSTFKYKFQHLNIIQTFEYNSKFKYKHSNLRLKHYPTLQSKMEKNK